MKLVREIVLKLLNIDLEQEYKRIKTHYSEQSEQLIQDLLA